MGKSSTSRARCGWLECRPRGLGEIIRAAKGASEYIVRHTLSAAIKKTKKKNNNSVLFFFKKYKKSVNLICLVVISQLSSQTNEILKYL